MTNRGQILALLFLLHLCGSHVHSQLVRSHIQDTVFEYRICKLKIYFPASRLPLDLTHSQGAGHKKHLLFSASGEASYQRFERHGDADHLLLLQSKNEIASLRLNVIYRENYPFSFYLRYNKSQPFQIDNQFEANLFFDNRGYKEIIREKLLSALNKDFLKDQKILQEQYEKTFRQYWQQSQILRDPAAIQQSMQSRFAVPSIPSMPSNIPTRDIPFSTDSIAIPKLTYVDSLFRNAQHKKDSLVLVMKTIEDSLQKQKATYSHKTDSIQRMINESVSTSSLQDLAQQNKIDSTKSRSLTDILLRSQMRFGKFILSNSELTVNNIFLQGFSIKYGLEKFIQVSGGYYDYSFRGIYNTRTEREFPKTSLWAIKAGRTDGTDLAAINLYLGSKQNSFSVSPTKRTIAGISLEKKIHLHKNLDLELEVAKSTPKPFSGDQKGNSTLKDLFLQVNEHTIGGYASLNSFLPRTKTNIEATYRYWGSRFESFSANQYYNPRHFFSGKFSQPLLKRKLFISSGIRYTDFNSYEVSNNIRNHVLFASINATLRLKKFPLLSFGYYPGSQLFWLQDRKLYEYFYYILNGSASHHFQLAKAPMQVVFTYNKFFNRYSDSLVSQSQSYHNIFWTTWIRRFSYQANYSFQQITNSTLRTFEAGVSYSGNKVRLGGTVKTNHFEDQRKWGYSLSAGLVFPELGSITILYDRSYLPERMGKILPVQTGQVQFIKPLNFKIWQKG